MLPVHGMPAVLWLVPLPLPPPPPLLRLEAPQLLPLQALLAGGLRLPAQPPALLAQHPLLPAGEGGLGRAGLAEPPAEPAALGVQGAVHAQVKPLQLACAEEAGRRAADGAV